MDERLKRVIELTAQLKEAVEACPDVLSVCLPNFGSETTNYGVHVYQPEDIGLGPMGIYRVDGDGQSWVRADIGGVNVFGALHESKGDGKNE